MTLHTVFYNILPLFTMLLYILTSTAVGYDTSSVLMMHQWNSKGDIERRSRFPNPNHTAEDK